MSQHDYNIANGGGAAVRADINAALLAVLSQNSGATAPTTTKPFMLWYDTTTGILKIRNAADSAWVTFAAGAIQDASIAQTKLATNVAGNGPAFSAYRAASQTVTTGTYTKVACDTEEFDTNSNYDPTTNYRFTPTVAGYYQVNGQINIYAASGMTRAFVGVYKNGSIAKWGTDITLPSNISGLRAHVSSLIYCNGTTDYVELYCYIVGSGTLILSAGTSDNYFQAALSRAA